MSSFSSPLSQSHFSRYHSNFLNTTTLINTALRGLALLLLIEMAMAACDEKTFYIQAEKGEHYGLDDDPRGPANGIGNGDCLQLILATHQENAPNFYLWEAVFNIFQRVQSGYFSGLRVLNDSSLCLPGSFVNTSWFGLDCEGVPPPPACQTASFILADADDGDARRPGSWEFLNLVNELMKAAILTPCFSPSPSPSPFSPTSDSASNPRLMNILIPLLLSLFAVGLLSFVYREKLTECCRESFSFGRNMAGHSGRNRGDWPAVNRGNAQGEYAVLGDA
jgi:hypothetical protein